MALDRDEADSELQRFEAHLDQPDVPAASSSLANVIELGNVPPAYQAAAEFLGGLLTPPQSSQGDKMSMHAVEALRQMCEVARSGRGSSLGGTEWRKPPRPRSARYMRTTCRITPDGCGGAPLTRPSSAPAGRRPPKTERWRESGLTRWPKESGKINHTSDPSDGDPLRRRLPQQPNWQGELWIRSLRRPGMDIQDPAYHDMGQRGLRDLHEEWQEPVRHTPRRPQSARAGTSRRPAPYYGKTTFGKVAIPLPYNPKDWVERPVATGIMSLNHLQGQRYTFNQTPRGLERED